MYAYSIVFNHNKKEVMTDATAWVSLKDLISGLALWLGGLTC